MITDEIIEQCIKEGRPIPPFMTDAQIVVLVLGLVIPAVIIFSIAIVLISNSI